MQSSSLVKPQWFFQDEQKKKKNHGKFMRKLLGKSEAVIAAKGA